MKIKVNILFTILISFFIAGCDTNQYVDTHAVKIKDHFFKVEIVHTRAAREKGLSGREQLKEDEGMLFLFPNHNLRTFWMKDMLIPIDIIWIKDNIVTGCESNVQPPNDPDIDDAFLPVYESGEAINNVLEVKAGFCEEQNISGGELVEYFNI